MYGKSRSVKIDFDYRIFNETGKKVIKVRKNPLKMSDLKIENLSCLNEIDSFFQINSIGEIELADELVTYVEELSDLGKNYRNIHSKLTVELGDTYGTEYPDFDKNNKKIIFGIKDAKKKLRELKSGKIFAENEQMVIELKIEEIFLREQIIQYLGGTNFGVSKSLDDLRKILSDLNTYLCKWHKLRWKIEGLL